MHYTLDVENIKCGGCANSIKKGLLEQPGVEQVTVDVEKGQVIIDGSEDSQSPVIEKLANMGYPLTGSVEGLKAASAKAKSFVSCAIGRIDNLHKDA